MSLKRCLELLDCSAATQRQMRCDPRSPGTDSGTPWNRFGPLVQSGKQVWTAVQASSRQSSIDIPGTHATRPILIACARLLLPFQGIASQPGSSHLIVRPFLRVRVRLVRTNSDSQFPHLRLAPNSETGKAEKQPSGVSDDTIPRTPLQCLPVPN